MAKRLARDGPDSEGSLATDWPLVLLLLGGGRDVGDVASSNSPSARCGGGGVQRLQHARAGGR